jgi:hypothetical protein
VIKGVFALMAAASIFATSAFAGSDFEVPVDKNFSEYTVSVNGYGNGYEALWDLINADGYIAVCGAGIYPDVSSKLAIKQLMRGAVVMMNDKAILKDLSFFTEVRGGQALAKAKASCRTTKQKVPTSKDNSFGIVLKGKRIRF